MPGGTRTRNTKAMTQYLKSYRGWVWSKQLYMCWLIIFNTQTSNGAVIDISTHGNVYTWKWGGWMGGVVHIVSLRVTMIGDPCAQIDVVKLSNDHGQFSGDLQKWSTWQINIDVVECRTMWFEDAVFDVVMKTMWFDIDYDTTMVILN